MDFAKACILTTVTLLFAGQAWASSLAPRAADFPADHPMRQILSGKSFCQPTSKRTSRDQLSIQMEIDTLAMLLGEDIAANLTSPFRDFLVAKYNQRIAIENLVEKKGSAEAVDQANRELTAALESLNRDRQIEELYSVTMLVRLNRLAQESVIDPYFESVFSQILEPVYREIYGRALSKKAKTRIRENLLCDLSPAETLALIYYSGQGSAPIERALLGDSAPSPLLNFSTLINRGLARMRPFQGIIQSGQSRLSQETFQVGEFEVPRYFSGSILNHRPFPGHQLKIQSKTCRWIALFSVNFNEDEVLCPTKSKFKILQTRKLNPGEFGHDDRREWLHVRVTQIK